MSYCFSKTLQISFDEAVLKITEELKKEGFGILADITIEVQAKLKKVIDIL